MFPEKLHKKLQDRIENNSFRTLSKLEKLVDFSSNDYLGFARSKDIFDKTHQYLLEKKYTQNGATGSRLLSGNHVLYDELELFLKEYHKSNSALVFNSGYDANLGFFSSVPQRNDVILYDNFSHASIRDGIKLSNAKAYSFKHNDLEDLEQKLQKHKVSSATEIYIVTESVFSMDGDSPDLMEMWEISKRNNAHLVVDEAHAIGVFGKGMVQELRLEKQVFARIITFGKALGCHGAAILGSQELKSYLINFARPFIYTTGLSPHALGTVKTAYEYLSETKHSKALEQNIEFFKEQIEKLGLKKHFIGSNSAVHCCVVSGNSKVKKIAAQLQENGFDVRPILSPTVPEGEERLRFCLHSYNSREEIAEVLQLLATFVTSP